MRLQMIQSVNSKRLNFNRTAMIGNMKKTRFTETGIGSEKAIDFTPG